MDVKLPDLALMRAEDRYRLLVESVTDYAIYMLDPAGVISSWNPGAQRFKGYFAPEVIGSNFSRFYEDADRAAGLPQRALAIAAREDRYEGEGWRVRKDGTRFWASVIIDPIRSPRGELIGYAKVTRDLSARRESDLALRRSEEHFRLLVQGVTDYAIYMLDADGNVTNWNAGAERIKQYTADEIVGQHFSHFYTPEDRAGGLPARALQMARDTGSFQAEGERVRKDGTRFWASVVIDPIYGDDGAILGFAKITRDITERRDAQRELESAREALIQSQKMEAIGQLTGGIAHDFNNLLAAVLGSLELLRKRLPDDPRSVQLLDNAAQAANRGASLTQRMLAFARRQDLNPESVDVAVLVSGIGDLLRRTLGPTVDLVTEFPPGLPSILTDPNQLELAILNLAVNARDAMLDGGVIRISARAETLDAPAADGLPAGAYVCLSVIDTGSGMDADTLARAAEPFFTTKGVGKGTGLGLSMVQGLAQQQGGRMRLHSEPGKGTTTELWLPLSASAAVASAPQEEPASQTDGALHILAVDDDALILMNTAAMLQDMGHTVHEAMSGAEALAILQANRIDLVITDQAMPQMTGTALAAAIRATHPALPIILATGYADLPPGADLGLPRLAKPFTLRDLDRAIARAMKPES